MKNCHNPLFLTLLFALIFQFTYAAPRPLTYAAPRSFPNAAARPLPYAASRPFPGYYITKNGDSIRCSIEYNDWYKNPKTIVVEVNNVKSTFAAADINGFGVTGYGDYKSATVSYHTNPVTGPNIPQEFSDQIETDDCFLKIVTLGVYSLYELVLPEKHYYFIQEGNGPISELIYRVKIDPINLTAIPDLRYKNVFSDLFAKENIGADYQYLITGAQYNKTSLERLIDRLNETKTGTKVTRSTNKNKERRLQLEVFAGGLSNSFPDPINGHYTSGNKMPSSFSPSGGVSLRYLIPGSFDAFSLGFSVGFDTYKTSVSKAGYGKDSSNSNDYSKTTYAENVSISNTFLMTNFNLMYRFIRSSKVNFYVKAGVGIDLSIAGNSKFQINYSDTIQYATNGILQPLAYGSYQQNPDYFVDVAASLNLDLGLIVGRNKLELAYYIPKQLAGAGESSFRVAQYGLYYYYTILK